MAIITSLGTSPLQLNNVALSVENAQEIVKKHFESGGSIKVSRLKEISRYGYSFTTGRKIYVVDLEAENAYARSSCFITISLVDESHDNDDYHTNSLQVVQNLLDSIRSKTKIPISDSIIDTSREIVPFDYLLSPPSPFASTDIISLQEAKQSTAVDSTHKVLIELMLGQFLAQLHTNVQNDWFGIPTLTEPSSPSYSWQATFTLLFETLVDRVRKQGENDGAVAELPYQDIQRHMSRAIAFFLFDDVEVPSLIWLTGSEDDIYISLPTHPSTKTPSVAAIVPSLGHAVWGDPLLETMFMDSDKSKTLVEGYTDSGGAPLITFPRQKTKRIWYTIYLAFLVLLESLEESTRGLLQSEQEDKKKWALEVIVQNVSSLEDSPCN